MIAKAVVKAFGFRIAEFPKPKQGEPPYEEFSYLDADGREPRLVTVPVDRQVPADTRPKEDEYVTAVFQVEQVERVVQRQDREDSGRTYGAAVKQFKARVIAFEKARQPDAKAAAQPAKAAA